MRQVEMFCRLIENSGSKLKLIGVGGIRTAGDVQGHFSWDCRHVQLATAAMLNPRIAIELRAQLPGLYLSGLYKEFRQPRDRVAVICSGPYGTKRR
jgi:dihydroorotate dehydrogenase